MILTGTIFNFRDLLDSLSPIVFPTIAIACSDSTSDAPGRRAGAYRRPDRNATSCNRRTPLCGPFAVAELVEAILPHVPETVPVNILQEKVFALPSSKVSSKTVSTGGSEKQ